MNDKGTYNLGLALVNRIQQLPIYLPLSPSHSLHHSDLIPQLLYSRSSQDSATIQRITPWWYSTRLPTASGRTPGGCYRRIFCSVSSPSVTSTFQDLRNSALWRERTTLLERSQGMKHTWILFYWFNKQQEKSCNPDVSLSQFIGRSRIATYFKIKLLRQMQMLCFLQLGAWLLFWTQIFHL